MEDKNNIIQKVTGTRDFYGIDLQKRNFVIEKIKDIYEKYGFTQLETPAFEYTSLLKNVYGNENEKLLYKILNSGDIFNNIDLKNELTENLKDKICEKCLRYDLTLPLMRYVYVNKNEIIFPFKRYQIQPVWRADRPQKGRYREFYQCDVDIVGSDSIYCEIELLNLAIDILNNFNIKNYSIKINSRGILFDIAKMLNIENKFIDFCILIDKIDKIGIDEIIEKLKSFENISLQNIDIISKIFTSDKSNLEKIENLKYLFINSKIDTKNIDDLYKFLISIKSCNIFDKLKVDFSLARGLNYYTGIIFEICVNDIKIGSIGGGGRYNYFAEKLNMSELKSVGFSFGLDRLLVVLDELKLLNVAKKDTDILFINQNNDFDFNLISELRKKYIVEIYFDENIDFKKQLKYANKKNIKYVIFKNKDIYIIKNMITGEQVEKNRNLIDFEVEKNILC